MLNSLLVQKVLFRAGKIVSCVLKDHLNHLLLLHVHKDRTDSLSLTHVAEQFVSSSEHRLSVFGRFS